MATIVRHRENGMRYILLGSDRKEYTWFPSLGIVVCDHLGQIHRFASTLVEVVEIDGQSPDCVLAGSDGISSASE